MLVDGLYINNWMNGCEVELKGVMEMVLLIQYNLIMVLLIQYYENGLINTVLFNFASDLIVLPVR